MIEVETIAELERLESIAGSWAQLAAQNRAPESGPSWMLAWWRRAAPREAELRSIAVFERNRMIGLAPLYLESSRSPCARYRLLADECSTIASPLAAPERAFEVAEAVASTLAAAERRPAILKLGPISLRSPWVLALRERWPSRLRPLALRAEVRVVPSVTLREEGFEDWLDRRRRSVREEARRCRATFEGEGGTVRRSTPDQVASDLERALEMQAFAEGGGRLIGTGKRRMLADLARRSAPSEELRLSMLELRGEPVCACLSLAAGGEVSVLGLLCDDRTDPASAGRLSILTTIEDAFERRDRRVLLGAAPEVLAGRLASGSEIVLEQMLLPVGPQLILALPRVARRAFEHRTNRSIARLGGPARAGSRGDGGAG